MGGGVVRILVLSYGMNNKRLHWIELGETFLQNINLKVWWWLHCSESVQWKSPGGFENPFQTVFQSCV